MKKLLFITLLMLPVLMYGQAAFIIPSLGSSSPSPDTINVQLWDSLRTQGKFTNAAWNSWAPVETVTASLTSPALKYSTGVQSPVHVSVSALNDYSANGATYGNSNTMGYPGGVFVVCEFDNANQSFTFSGVPANSSVRIEIVASSVLVPNNPTNVAFADGAVTQTINVLNNLTVLGVLSPLATSAGSVTFTCTPANTYSVVCALRLIIKH